MLFLSASLWLFGIQDVSNRTSYASFPTWVIKKMTKITTAENPILVVVMVQQQQSVYSHLRLAAGRFLYHTFTHLHTQS